jgi:hypothetical protein
VWPTGAEYTIVVRPFVLDVNSSQAVKLEPSGLARRGHGLFRRSAPQLDEGGQQAEQWAVDRNFLIRPRRSLVRRFLGALAFLAALHGKSDFSGPLFTFVDFKTLCLVIHFIKISYF